MPMQESVTPVVAGIDGSPAALEAARWGAAEAIGRGVGLRLVHVVDVEADLDPDMDEDPAEATRDWPETTGGLQALAAASSAAHDLGGRLDVTSHIVYGDVVSTLVDESGRASLLCLGSTGVTPVCRRLLGSTAVTLAERGHCPVAVIRTPSGASSPDPRWIVVAVDGGPDDDRIVDYAVDEARRRSAPVLALDVSERDHGAHREFRWQERHPNVLLYPMRSPSGIADFLSQQDDLGVQLAVLGGTDDGQVAAILGLHRQSGRPSSQCSVLVVR